MDFKNLPEENQVRACAVPIQNLISTMTLNAFKIRLIGIKLAGKQTIYIIYSPSQGQALNKIIW